MPIAPYDPYAPVNPWWQQRQQQPQQQGQQQFAQPPAPQQPKQWYEGLPTPMGKSGGGQSPQDGQPNQPPGLLQMMTNLGRMSRPQYDQAIKGGGQSGMPPGAAAQVSPWAWLGNMGGGR